MLLQPFFSRPKRLRIALAMLGGLLSACTTSQQERPPVQIVDRSTSPSGSGASGPAPIVSASASTGTGRTYVVRKGDTLYKIAVEHGKDFRDIAALNQLESPDRILVGQTLRIDADAGASAPAATPAVVATPVVIGAPLDSKPLGEAGKSGAAKPADVGGKPADAAKPTDAARPDAGKPATVPDAKPSPVAAPADSAKPAADDGPITWAWPTGGRVIDGFDDPRNKGLDLGGNVGDAVLAAGDGKVVYAGNGLRGYGQLLIIKHNDNFLSAYAHNSKLVAKYGDSVKRGQKIAELGNTDTDKPKLHFEIRRQGKPVDPAKYLPAR
ncbi:peptidoglycan DD-metalloendopeptidase family protein [Derxia gummosa]|uniref:Peptidoglycan DD-metalloendopeptidase family protein n=1 Tax=Derxia gummosa DSM 723 TaxID=1121388 RepID=A0A9U5GFW2_9BURK|nr:peptidoglycan DD-metalloendopeptidase family protein [Derxia gummosa]